MDDIYADRDDEIAGLTDDALEEELTIAATGTDDDPEREDRLEDLVEEREHRLQDDDSDDGDD